MRPNLEGVDKLEGYFNALSDVKTKILELRPHAQYLSDYHEGQLDLCDLLLDFINGLKKNAN